METILKDIEKRNEERIERFEKVKRGEEVLCPRCKKGYLKYRGSVFFYCDNVECGIKITFDPARE